MISNVLNIVLSGIIISLAFLYKKKDDEYWEGKKEYWELGAEKEKLSMEKHITEMEKIELQKELLILTDKQKKLEDKQRKLEDSRAQKMLQSLEIDIEQGKDITNTVDAYIKLREYIKNGG